MPRVRFPAAFLFLSAGLLAQPDPAASQRPELERQERRELAKINQAEEQERIKLRSRERDEFARIQRDAAVSAGSASVAIAATGSLAAADTTKLIEFTFAQDEVRNLMQNQLGADVTVRFKRERNAVNRKFTLERAKLAAAQIDTGADSGKQRDLAVKAAEVSAKCQEQLDDLGLEEETEAARLRFNHTTRINGAERDLAALSARLMMAQINKGTAATYNPAADPEIARLSKARDEAKNALDTALDELRAKFTVRRTEIENAREDEPAKAATG